MLPSNIFNIQFQNFNSIILVSFSMFIIHTLSLGYQPSILTSSFRLAFIIPYYPMLPHCFGSIVSFFDRHFTAIFVFWPFIFKRYSYLKLFSFVRPSPLLLHCSLTRLPIRFFSILFSVFMKNFSVCSLVSIRCFCCVLLFWFRMFEEAINLSFCLPQGLLQYSQSSHFPRLKFSKIPPLLYITDPLIHGIRVCLLLSPFSQSASVISSNSAQTIGQSVCWCRQFFQPD